jgi:hypothetical protein
MLRGQVPSLVPLEAVRPQTQVCRSRSPMPIDETDPPLTRVVSHVVS